MRDALTLLALGALFALAAPAIAFADMLRRERPVRGLASWYGAEHAGQPMANGEPFDPEALTCAAWDWPLGTVLGIYSAEARRTVIVIVTDRGPARRLHAQGRLVDLSARAFAALMPLARGVVEVEITVLEEAK
jgi:rare lipoprotein A